MTGDDTRLAATVVMTRPGPTGPEVLMLRRSAGSPAFPGMWVFPGGTVSEADRASDGDALRAAAVREVEEECGLVLAADDLEPLSEWLPPEQARARFRTSFYRAAYVAGEVRTDDFEVVEHAWITAAGALARHAEGAWDFGPPTWVTLAAMATEDSHPAREFHSHVVGSEPTILAWAGDERHPDRPGPAGARHRITLGPRPWVYLRCNAHEPAAPEPKEAAA
ncbi:NUDIX hydrolase [Microbacterium sp. zg-Y818]|uniref:NUDIX hydrolase n=1 Tax=unclassified Microbacterium TaxID=2609290 RepID=UPI00214B0257|nr:MULTISPECIES: NUDIX hydrolase [unclassified Microbacterium]MCR2799304.1 NUDIX hydrolase [Microbacterium sp. zg.Y818]WIM21305.1 NUDIX hydrolase [Microbacterium sp. zg-Y818]